MTLTGTVHPPAGATALLALVDDASISLGWCLIPVMLLGCSLMLAVALVVNNIQRRFPIYWWTPQTIKRVEEEAISTDGDSKFTPSVRQIEGGDIIDVALVIRRGTIQTPKHLRLSDTELSMLESIRNRL
jgi:hypothetical protein